MPIAEKYRIEAPVLALVLKNGRHVPHLLKAGAVVTWERPEIGRLVQVRWEETTALMFVQDLASNATKID